MAYPFADNRYAQNSSNHSHAYNDPYAGRYAGATEPAYTEERDSYDYDPRGMSRDAVPVPTAPYASYPTEPPQDDEYVHNEKIAATPGYGTSQDLLSSSPYAGKSIWTADDKRVMGKRNVPARIFR
jgi:hypothetical protein